MIRRPHARIASCHPAPPPFVANVRSSATLAKALAAALTLVIAGPGCSAGSSAASSDAAAAGGCGSDAKSGATGCGDPDPGTLEFLDNMEDGDSAILARDGRNGLWYTFHDDTTGTLNPDMNTTVTMEPIVCGRCEKSTHAMRVTGSGFSEWGSGFGFIFKTAQTDGVYAEAPYDISPYRGVTFWARSGETSVTTIRIGIGDQWSVPRGGHCDKTVTGDTGCYDYFGSSIPLSPAWKRYAIPFGELQQRSFGIPRPSLDVAAVYLVEFSMPPASPVFDIWIDDVALYQ